MSDDDAPDTYPSKSGRRSPGGRRKDYRSRRSLLGSAELARQSIASSLGTTDEACIEPRPRRRGPGTRRHGRRCASLRLIPGFAGWWLPSFHLETGELVTDSVPERAGD